MKPSVRIIQNCFLAEQLDHCSFEPYLNTIPDPPDERYLFCESNVIRQLVLDQWHQGYDYFGVLGHAWIAKLHACRTWDIPIKNISTADLSAESLISFVHKNPEADFISFGRFVSHRVFQAAEKIHPGWIAATSRILDYLGIQYNLERLIKKPIYFNFFVGRAACMEAYVRELLNPAVEASIHDQTIRQLCFKDAGYFRTWPKDLYENYQIPHYPLHPFIGERLINIYTDLAGSSVATYDAESSPINKMRSIVRMTTHQIHWLAREKRMAYAAIRSPR
jgi:hypothetical protein